MRNDAPKRDGQSKNGLFSVRSLSNYMRIMSSGASTAASTLRSAGASLVSSISNDDAGRDQVYWAGFDKLECEGQVLRQVLLLAFRLGFQVWDVEHADDVRQLVSKHDGPVSFMQMQKKPLTSKICEDRFSDVQPLLIISRDGSFSGSRNNSEILSGPCNETTNDYQNLESENLFPAFVHFYSLGAHDYVHVLKFRSAVYSIRCSSRVVAISQASQIHCFNSVTLEREYTILTNPIVSAIPGSGVTGYGPLAVGSRWLAYSGSPVAISDSGRVNSQLLSPTSVSLPPPDGSLVALYAKESSKQLAAGIVTIADIGYKKLSKYCSDLLPNDNRSIKIGNSSTKDNGTMNEHTSDDENAGMVIVRDIVSKSVVVQFRAHTSSISALCFDPSGTLLVTASIHGRDINIFCIMPSLQGSSQRSDVNGTYVHLYRLQRGITNAIIKDISFSDDSQWVMISSSRGTSHLFSLSPFEASANYQISENNCANNNYMMHPTSKTVFPCSQTSSSLKLHEDSLSTSGAPVTLSVASRIRNGSNGLKSAVRGAAAFATGVVSPISGAIASAFHNSEGYPNNCSMWRKYYLLVFSPSGCVIQYVLHHPQVQDSGMDISGFSAGSHGSSKETDTTFVVRALQKWDICHKRNRRDSGDSVDIYGDQGNGENINVFQKGVNKGTNLSHVNSGCDSKLKISAAENNHLYISEMELQMHAVQVPLWSKYGICFQVMMDEKMEVDNSSAVGREIEIERIPTRTIAARSKDLRPVFDCYRRSRSQQVSVSTLDINIKGQPLCQKSGLTEDGRPSCRSSCSSSECMCGSAAVADRSNVIDENSWVSYPTGIYEGAISKGTANPHART
ncbi:autophagy-related protein 18f-like isoform X2 [Typha latifolia]|uniref:autophagy-related protein 18f-like isoform X2 n=1 Tax=Typha latifolia TaxID=4733 RepID=UPI003C2F0D5B